MLLSIRHRTEYRYARPVRLQPHRLIVCPRGSHDLILRSRALDCVPAATIDWTQDVFGNLIATASFAEATAALAIESRMIVDHCAAAWPLFAIAPSAHRHPFAYSPDEAIDLAALIAPPPEAGADPAAGAVAAWARGFAAPGTDSLTLLKTINAAIHRGIAYRARDEEGTQRAGETLAIASGSCRDLATLLIAAVRSLGFAARAVSGYLRLDAAAGGGAQHGATHAWAEIYLPGAGWIAFDPTNGRMGAADLIAVAVARDIAQILPVTGSYVGAPEDFLAMTIDVRVEELPAPPPAQG